MRFIFLKNLIMIFFFSQNLLGNYIHDTSITKKFQVTNKKNGRRICHKYMFLSFPFLFFQAIQGRSVEFSNAVAMKVNGTCAMLENFVSNLSRYFIILPSCLRDQHGLDCIIDNTSNADFHILF